MGGNAPKPAEPAGAVRFADARARATPYRRGRGVGTAPAPANRSAPLPFHSSHPRDSGVGAYGAGGRVTRRAVRAGRPCAFPIAGVPRGALAERSP